FVSSRINPSPQPLETNEKNSNLIPNISSNSTKLHVSTNSNLSNSLSFKRFWPELSSLLPAHSAIASACLVSKRRSIADATNEVSIKNLSFKRFQSAVETAKRDLIENLRENATLEVCHI
ncbi:hypothetical protein GIB67_021097, partial [Kingdonia uniflora]